MRVGRRWRPGIREHEEDLPVHVAPAGEHGHAHEKQEHLLELEVLEVEGVGEHHEEQADENQVEHEPGDQESTPPGAQPMRLQAVTGWGDGGKSAEKSAKEEHPVPVVVLRGHSNHDHGDTRHHVADVEEQEASQQWGGGSQDFCQFLMASQGPQSRAQIPQCLKTSSNSHSLLALLMYCITM